jgi:hypothetical protein
MASDSSIPQMILFIIPSLRCGSRFDMPETGPEAVEW